MSDRYDGLNLPQLLDLLHEPVVPEPVPWLPQTAGWQLVGAWALAVAVLVGVHYYRRWVRNRYRREALERLRAIAGRRHDADVPGQIALLLKQTALAVYPRARVANLYGAEWAAFLVESSGGDSRVAAAAADLAAAAYRPGIRGEQLVGPARRWIKVHRA